MRSGRNTCAPASCRRQTNYPGSTYTLTYDPASDQLKGVYYQAVEKQQFPVAFLRMK